MTDTPENPADEQATDNPVNEPAQPSTPQPAPVNSDAESSTPAEVSNESAESHPLTEEELKKKKEDALFWNCLIAIMMLLVVGVGYLVFDQYSKLPDPIQDIKNELAANHAKILEKQAQLKAAQDKCIPKKQLLDILDIQKNTAEQIEETQKSIDDARQRVAGVRGEIRSYFSRYRQNARKNAKGKKYKILKTVSGKTYIEVVIKHIYKDRVNISFNGGNCDIAASDLPDDIRTEFAYGDPLNIHEMNQSDDALKSPVVERKKKTAPTPKPAPKQKETVIIDDLEPPSGSPHIQTPTQSDESGTQDNGDVWVPPAHSELPEL